MPSLYIQEIACFVRQHCQYLALNEHVHNYNTKQHKDIHVKSCNTEMGKKSVIRMGTKIYNKLPGFIKKVEKYDNFKRELKTFLHVHSFYSIEEFFKSKYWKYVIISNTKIDGECI